MWDKRIHLFIDCDSEEALREKLWKIDRKPFLKMENSFQYQYLIAFFPIHFIMFPIITCPTTVTF